MRNTITVMNAKGGVGKSTLILALAETLSAFHGKKILVIDSDAQASISHMLLPQRQLEALQEEGQTIVDYLIATVLKETPSDWRRYVIAGVSDVDDARTIDLLPSDTNLTLFEREVSKGDRETHLRRTVGACLREAQQAYDYVFIDSAPGLSVLTECWLREAAFYMSPTRPDYISTRGLAFMRKFRQRNPGDGLCRAAGRDRQHEGPAVLRGRSIRPVAPAGPRQPLLLAADLARDAPAVGRLLLAERPVVLGQVSGPDRRPAPLT